MTLYQWLCVLGVPTLVLAAYKYLYSKIKMNAEETKRNAEENKVIKSAMQALLRAQMIDDYNKWSDRGFAPIYARQSFENCWKWYHTLGENGVMDDIHEKFLALPTEPPQGVQQ